MSKADDIKALPIGSVIAWQTPEEGKVAFLKGVVFAGDSPQDAEEISVWIAPNLQTFDEAAFTEDEVVADLEIVFVAQPLEDSE